MAPTLMFRYEEISLSGDSVVGLSGVRIRVIFWILSNILDLRDWVLCRQCRCLLRVVLGTCATIRMPQANTFQRRRWSYDIHVIGQPPLSASISSGAGNV